MSEIIDPNSIRANTPDWQEGYEQGKKFAQNKVLELMDEVIAEYEAQPIIGDECRTTRLNALKFISIMVEPS